jgi:nicotinate-nucleotide adenylyltransferase
MQPAGAGARMKIGLLGGSFNPAHAGHLHVSREALKRLALDEIWWLVSPGNPLKAKKDMAPLAKRLASARAMAAGERRIRVTDIERNLGTVYTVDTLRALKKRFPKAQFVWLMGADNLAQFSRWKRWREIARLIPIAVFDRSPFSHHALRGKAALALALGRTLPKTLLRRALPAWAYILMRRHAASSTAIRKGKQKR